MMKEHIENEISFFLERGRYQQAAALIGPALAQEPDNTFLLYASAYIDSEQDELGAAEETLLHLLTISPKHDNARYLLLHVYRDMKNYVGAEELAIDLIQDSPENSAYYTAYAWIMLDNMHIDKANKLAQEALRLEPEASGPLCVSTLCSVISGNTLQAHRNLSDLMNDYPELEITARTLIIHLNQENKHREALRVAQEVLRNNPKDENLVEIVKELRAVSHPAMWPMRPLVRFGWGGSAACWGIALALIYSLRSLGLHEAAGILSFIWIGYALYSWVAPPLIRRFLV